MLEEAGEFLLISRVKALLEDSYSEAPHIIVNSSEAPECLLSHSDCTSKIATVPQLLMEWQIEKIGHN